MTIDDIKWGVAIPVSGERPSWLGDYNGSLGYIRSDTGQYGPGLMWSERDITGNRPEWRNVTAIILPADHPHYAQPSPADTVMVGVAPKSEAEWNDIYWKAVGSPQCKAYMSKTVRKMLDSAGLIRPATKAERIATKTGLSVKDVEAVLAAVGEGE